MTGNEYQEKAARTFPLYSKRDNMIKHAVFGLYSEAGEVAGIFQKKYQGHEIDKEHIKKELGDCLWMIAEACTAFGFTMEEVMATNIEKLLSRYPNSFDTEKTIHRKADDV